MKTSIISGITGQDGAYLSRLLLEKGYQVYGAYRPGSLDNFWRIEELGLRRHPKLHLVEHQLTDLGASIALIEKVQPDEIYNLAAQSSVAMSFEQPYSTAQVTGVGALNLLEAIRLVNPRIRFYQASSSEMFDKVASIAQTEDALFYPRSPYAVAKLNAHWSTVNYRESYNIFASSGILFNHESPLRGIEFVTRKIADGFARIKLGRQKTLALGNLDAKRDWGHARDFVKAMWLMLQQESPDDYVIATGRTESVRDFCALAFGHVGLKMEDHVTVDQRFFRPAEVDVLLGDPAKARERLGWVPETTLEQLVVEMVEADIERIRKHDHL